MNKLRIRRLQIAVVAENARFACDVTFNDGLNVIHARNSSGKSSIVMGILYGLGLEGMLGPSPAPPFPDSMLDTILEGEVPYNVIESCVTIEIEGANEQFLTCKRIVQEPSERVASRRQLISVHRGQLLSAPERAESLGDYFVRMRDAATSSKGFHTFLTQFLGWSLPSVRTFDGNEAQLYLECVFPYFFVDQLSGWREIKARMPTYLRIPDMAKRGFEFVLKLDYLNKQLERQDIEIRRQEIEQRWQQKLQALEAAAGSKMLSISGLPKKCPTAMPDKLKIEYTDGQNWMLLAHAVTAKQEELDRLMKIASMTLQRAAQRATAEVAEAELEYERLRLSSDQLKELQSLDQKLVASIELRMNTLAEENREYLDTKRILDRGGFVESSVAKGYCPTCRQSMKDTLLEQGGQHTPMSLEQNIAFIRDEYHSLLGSRNNLTKSLQSRTVQLNALTEKILECVQRIRETRRSILAADGSPSESDIGKRLMLEREVDQLGSVSEWWEGQRAELNVIVNDFKGCSGESDAITLSDTDTKKLGAVQKAFLEQLSAYGFRSYKLSEIYLDRESYRPSRFDRELGLTSASDAVRLVWAQLLSMLEVSRSFDTHHLGLLIFDEPKQQNADDVSLQELLLRAEASIDFGQQIIVATSKDTSTTTLELKVERFTLIQVGEEERFLVRQQELQNDIPF